MTTYYRMTCKHRNQKYSARTLVGTTDRVAPGSPLYPADVLKKLKPLFTKSGFKCKLVKDNPPKHQKRAVARYYRAMAKRIAMQRSW